MKVYDLPDIQKTKTGFPKIPINKVGMRNIKLPFLISTKEGGVQTVTATISSYCNLSAETKGINMSRITRTIVDEFSQTTGSVGVTNLAHLANKLQKAHDTDNIYIKASFDYFLKSKSPVENLDSPEHVEVVFESLLFGEEKHNYLTTRNVSMSLCPCSKEMSMLKNNITVKEEKELKKLPLSLYSKVMKSGFGAHNQKSYIEIKVELKPNVEKMWIEDLVQIAHESASSPTYTVLKRPEEKRITEISYMKGYFNDKKKFIEVNFGGPAFVEDISRNIALKLNKYLDLIISDYIIIVNNEESIHSSGIVATSVLSCGRSLS